MHVCCRIFLAILCFFLAIIGCIVLLLALVRCRGCRRRRRNILEIYAFLINRGNVCKKTMAAAEAAAAEKAQTNGQSKLLEICEFNNQLERSLLLCFSVPIASLPLPLPLSPSLSVQNLLSCQLAKMLAISACPLLFRRKKEAKVRFAMKRRWWASFVITPPILLPFFSTHFSPSLSH